MFFESGKSSLSDCSGFDTIPLALALALALVLVLAPMVVQAMTGMSMAM